MDLRLGGQIWLQVDQGVSYSPFWGGLPNLDSEYTLVLDPGLATEVTYTVAGGGLVLDAQTSSVTWILDASILSKKTYHGYIESQSKVAGVYFKVNIKLEVC